MCACVCQSGFLQIFSAAGLPIISSLPTHTHTSNISAQHFSSIGKQQQASQFTCTTLLLVFNTLHDGYHQVSVVTEKGAFSTYLASTTRKGGKDGRQWRTKQKHWGGVGNQGRNHCQAFLYFQYFLSRCALGKKSLSRVVFLQPCVSFREKEQRKKERKDNRNVLTTSFTSPSQERNKYGSNYTLSS